MPKDFYSAVRDRRSWYAIGGDSPVSDERIAEVVRFAVKHAPTAFNSQSGRAALLLGEEHGALWDIVLDTLAKIVPAERFAPTREKIAGFRAGHGTALFFEDRAVVEEMQREYPKYGGNFPVWSMQSSGMLQYIVWAALENEGLGASLQHYNPLIDEAVKRRWKLPESWALVSQMPFGKPLEPPGEKEFLPLEDRFRIFGE
jgi:predicted oxidoreductase (fatty acid repression mutant protein)